MKTKEDRIDLSAEEYNRLRDFESAVRRKDVIRIDSVYGNKENPVYLSTNKAVIEIGEANKVLGESNKVYKEANAEINQTRNNLRLENNALSCKLRSLEDKILYGTKETLSKAQEQHFDRIVQRLQGMSIWAFIKWRRK